MDDVLPLGPGETDSRSPRFACPKPRLSTALAEIVLVILPFVLARLAAMRLDFIYLGPIAVVLCVLIATGLLRARGQSWRALGLKRPRSWVRTALGAGATVIAIAAVGFFVVRPVLGLLGLGSPDISALAVVRQDPITFLVFLLPLSWGTAAFGEEMIARGFILNRVAAALGNVRLGWLAGLLTQALVFGAAHSWQGPSGMLTTFVLALVFGGAYLLANRDLWVCILAHGVVDSGSVIAIYCGAMDLATGQFGGLS